MTKYNKDTGEVSVDSDGLSTGGEFAEPVSRSKKQRAETEPTLIGNLDSGVEILKALLRDYHHHLASVNIRLLCTNKDIKVGGRQRPGKVQKTTPLLKYFTRDEDGNNEADIIVLVSLPVWNTADQNERTAMLDHLLSMVEASEDETTGATKLAIVAPQVQEFADVVERRGLYNRDVQDLASVIHAG